MNYNLIFVWPCNFSKYICYNFNIMWFFFTYIIFLCVFCFPSFFSLSLYIHKRIHRSNLKARSCSRRNRCCTVSGYHTGILQHFNTLQNICCKCMRKLNEEKKKYIFVISKSRRKMWSYVESRGHSGSPYFFHTRTVFNMLFDSWQWHSSLFLLLIVLCEWPVSHAVSLNHSLHSEYILFNISHPEEQSLYLFV